jgi:hypothetical protein
LRGRRLPKRRMTKKERNGSRGMSQEFSATVSPS